MGYKDILATLLSISEDDPALAAAEAVAKAMEGKVTVLMVEVLPPPLHTVEGAALRLLWADILEQEHQEFVTETTRVRARAADNAATMSVRSLSTRSDKLVAAIGAQARCADLTVMLRPRPSAKDFYRLPMFEGVLFGSGRPVLLVPPGWRPGAIGSNVIVAWNGRREAARALADAAPFLARANQVTVVAIAPSDSPPDLTQAESVVAHLARRGVGAKARGVIASGRDEAAVLLDVTREQRADLLVMGGYGRSRLSETALGGVTRDVIEFAPIPVLISH